MELIKFSQGLSSEITKFTSLKEVKSMIPDVAGTIWGRNRDAIPKIDVKKSPHQLEEKPTPPLLNETEQSLPYTYLPDSNGRWSGKRGNSEWIPDKESSLGQILSKYGRESITFKDNYPDFSPFTKATVEIEDFSPNRWENFAQADKKLAETWTASGKDGKIWTATDIGEYRRTNKLTWHEKEDQATMQLVDTNVHGNTPHSGGISLAKNSIKNT
jgi:hypothetical protein